MGHSPKIGSQGISGDRLGTSAVTGACETTGGLLRVCGVLGVANGLPRKQNTQNLEGQLWLSRMTRSQHNYSLTWDPSSPSSCLSHSLLICDRRELGPRVSQPLLRLQKSCHWQKRREGGGAGGGDGPHEWKLLWGGSRREGGGSERERDGHRGRKVQSHLLVCV